MWHNILEANNFFLRERKREAGEKKGKDHRKTNKREKKKDVERKGTRKKGHEKEIVK